MGVRKYFSRVGKVDILVVHFRLLTMQMQIDVHVTLDVHIKIFLFSFHIVRFFSHRDLLLSAVAASLHYLPQMSAFNSHMQQNAYCRNLNEPLLPCYCYVIEGNFKTILPRVSQPASAGNVADLVNCKLISHHCMMPEQ